MTEKTLMKIAKNNDYIVLDKKYYYWDNVTFFNNTAICFDVITEDGAETIFRYAKDFPKFVTKEYIKNVIESNAQSLGVIDYRNKNKFGGKIYYKFDEKRY